MSTDISCVLLCSLLMIVGSRYSPFLRFAVIWNSSPTEAEFSISRRSRTDRDNISTRIEMKELFCIKKSNHSRGSVLFRWDPTNKYIASVGVNRRVNIFERNGAQLDEFALGGKPTNLPMQIEWDKDGENLAVLCDGHSVLTFWNVHTRKTSSFDTNLKDACFLTWSRVGPQLAITTVKGTVLIYNQETKKSNTITGRHTKKITCGMWNMENRLALASLDKTMSINTETGELIEQPKLKYDPYDVQFAEQKCDEKNQQGKENTVSVNMGHQTILMYNLIDSDNPVELAFQPKYGEIATYKWFGDGYMMVGFSKGYIIAISTHMKEIGEELQSLKIHEQQLYDIAYSQVLNKLVTCGNDGLRLIDMSDWREVKGEHKEFTREEGDPEHMEWTKDGQILSVSTTGGYVFNYLMSIPIISASFGTKIVYLSSLRTVSILDVVQDLPLVTVDITIEPAFLALGTSYIAVGMNNHCWFHEWSSGQAGSGKQQSSSNPSSSSQVYEREYLGSVKHLLLNDQYAAVLLDNGSLNLHLIQAQPNEERDSKIFPEEKDASSDGGGGNENGSIRITSHCLTSEFLIYSTSRGSIHYFYLRDWTQVVEHRHELRITSIYSNPLGTRLVFVDENARGWLYSPVDDSKIEVTGFPSSGIDKILFDLVDSNTFVAVDTKNTRTLTTFTYSAQTTRGSTCTKVPAITKLSGGSGSNGSGSSSSSSSSSNNQQQLSHISIFYDGYIHGQKVNGSMGSMKLASHDLISGSADSVNGTGHGGPNATKRLGQRAHNSSDKLRQSFTQYLSLNRLKAAWDLTLQMKSSKEILLQLGKKALDQLDIDLAIRVYRELHDTGMVLALTQIKHVEDKDLLSGHILLLQGDYNTAQKYFLSSTAPLNALQMRRDLLHWDMALKLAQQLSPTSIPEISKEYAQSLEVKGEFQQALLMYQKALQLEEMPVGSAQKAKHSKEHMRIVQSGIVRMTLRCGDLQKGRTLAYNSGDKLLMKECASILEQMKQLSDAADMYVQAESYERAAFLYNQQMNFAKSAPLMEKITTPKIHLQYAKAKESTKDYATAVIAYEKAKDLDSVIRLNLQYLDQPQKAFNIVRQTKSPEGASLVAEYCRKHQNIQAAIEFLLLAHKRDEAFRLAKEEKQMEKYSNAIGEDGTKEEYQSIANYYEDQKDWTNAGHYYTRLGDYQRAIKYYLQSDNSLQNIDSAINVVKKSQGTPGCELLVRQLHDYLIGETDGIVKDLNYIFRLYMAIGEFQQAEKTAILISNQEQSIGHYSVAQSILFAMNQDLMRENLPVSNELRRNLLLLHSYTLAKKMSVRKEHDAAARMLVRVAKNISKFPTHIVPILTSTVIECQRAGLKRDSLEYAKILLRPEYKPKILAQYLKPIEGFVRRPPSAEELEKEKQESSTPCPFCQFELPETLLDCPSCKNSLPYCITTGKHMLVQDWCECPSCHFPTLYSEFVKYISTSPEKKCTMCDAVVNLADVQRLKDPKKKLYRQQSNDSSSSSSSAQEEKENNSEGGPSASTPSSSAFSAQQQKGAQQFDAVDIQPIFK